MNEFLNGNRPDAATTTNTTTTQSVAAARGNVVLVLVKAKLTERKKEREKCTCCACVLGEGVGATSGKARGSARNDVILYDRRPEWVCTSTMIIQRRLSTSIRHLISLPLPLCVCVYVQYAFTSFVPSFNF